MARMNISIMKQPSAFLPVAMSFAALAVVLVHLIRFGVARETDEGTAACFVLSVDFPFRLE